MTCGLHPIQVIWAFKSHCQTKKAVLWSHERVVVLEDPPPVAKSLHHTVLSPLCSSLKCSELAFPLPHGLDTEAPFTPSINVQKIEQVSIFALAWD